jgi:glycosyltransferase involved in cell wall biosynthesis
MNQVAVYSICTAFYKDVATLLRFLTSLKAYPPTKPFEVLLAGDTVNETELAVISEALSDVKDELNACSRVSLKFFERRLPLPLKHNLNICLAVGEFIVFCDDDIVFTHHGWADRLANALSGERVIAAAGCTDSPETASRAQRIPAKWNPDEHRGEQAEIEELSGFFWMAPRSAFDPTAIGMFQTFGFVYGDDTDWGMRARKVFGQRIVACRDVVVNHVRDSSDYALRAATGRLYAERRAKGLLGYE